MSSNDNDTEISSSGTNNDNLSSPKATTDVATAEEANLQETNINKEEAGVKEVPDVTTKVVHFKPKPNSNVAPLPPRGTRSRSSSSSSSHGLKHGNAGMSNVAYSGVIRDMNKAYCSVNDEFTSEAQARMIFARSAAVATFFINITFLLGGGLFFASQTDWAVVDIALFTVYTVTSAGYGHLEIPTTALFRIFDSFYIMIGLVLMAIMMAQGYQYLQMEGMRLHPASDRAEVLEQGIKRLKKEPKGHKRDKLLAQLQAQKSEKMGIFDKFVLLLTRVVVFSTENAWGDFLYRIASLAALCASGAIPVGLIEGWNWYSSIYWSIVSLTTVGYGDMVPQTVAGKAFTTVWLPLNLFFLSILFCSVGHYYLIFSDQQIKKIQKRLQENWAEESLKRKNIADPPPSEHDPEEDSQEAADVFVTDIVRDLEAGRSLPYTKLQASAAQSVSFRSIDLPMNRHFFGANLDTMEDVFKLMNERNETYEVPEADVGEFDEPSAILLHGDAPNFYLRVKVKERMAFIVAEEVAGRESSLKTEDKAGTLAVYLGGTVDAAEKWMIPRGARRAFRAVAFEALLFVGESTLVKEGVEALHRLKPLEFHRIFSPVLVAMGDKENLKNWLASTEVLWIKILENDRERRMSEQSLHTGHKDFAKSGEKIQFQTNHAEGFHLFHGT